MTSSCNSKALVIILLFRMLFGGYIVGMDQYYFSDIESALTVLVIYVLIAIFLTIFLLGKRYGITGIIGLESIFITLNSIFIIVSLSQTADVGMHNPVDNWWATLLRYVFSLLTLTFSIKIYKESK